MMVENRSTKRVKEVSEEAVLSALAKKSPQRWSELLKNVNLSSRTLKKALDRMIDKNDVYRHVEAEAGYPPPVFYGVTDNGKEKIKPIIFTIQASQYTSGFDLEWQKSKKTDNGVQLPVIFKTHFEGRTLKQILDEIGKRVGALYLYALVKSMEEDRIDWMINVSNNLINPYLFLLHFSEILPGIKQQIQDGKTMKAEITPLDNENVLFEYPQFPSLSKGDVQKLFDLLRETYPKEIESFDVILKLI